MTDADALLAAILANPDDDLPRLVYADWLEENAGTVGCQDCHGVGSHWIDLDMRRCRTCSGSGRVPDGRAERAAFIRVHCELAKVGPTWDIEMETGGEDFIDGMHHGGGEVVVEDVRTPPPIGSRTNVRVCPSMKRVRGMRVFAVKEQPAEFEFVTGERWRVHLKRDEYSGKAGAKKIAALRSRERELWAVCRAQNWFGDLPIGVGLEVVNVTTAPVGWVRRGFIEHVTCATDDWLQFGDRIMGVQPVRELTLTTWPEEISGNMPEAVQMAFRTRWPGLRKVTLPPPMRIEEGTMYNDVYRPTRIGATDG